MRKEAENASHSLSFTPQKKKKPHLSESMVPNTAECTAKNNELPSPGIVCIYLLLFPPDLTNQRDKPLKSLFTQTSLQNQPLPMVYGTNSRNKTTMRRIYQKGFYYYRNASTPFNHDGFLNSKGAAYKKPKYLPVNTKITKIYYTLLIKRKSAAHLLQPTTTLSQCLFLSG